MSDVQIHPTAIIDPGAEIGSGTIVGPYCVIGPDVVLGPNITSRSVGRRRPVRKTDFTPTVPSASKHRT